MYPNLKQEHEGYTVNDRAGVLNQVPFIAYTCLSFIAEVANMAYRSNLAHHSSHIFYEALLKTDSKGKIE